MNGHPCVEPPDAGPAVLKLTARVYVHPHARDGHHVAGYWRGLGGVPRFGRPVDVAHSVDFADQRKVPGGRLVLDPDALGRMMDAAGIVTTPSTRLRVRLRDLTGAEGYTKKLGSDQHRVVVEVAPKDLHDDAALYVINNTLQHELRHVSQSQVDPNNQTAYTVESMKHGYWNNAYEAEARLFGHLADVTGEKYTGPHLPKGLGQSLWALRNP